jgi:hypothetical protein
LTAAPTGLPKDKKPLVKINEVDGDVSTILTRVSSALESAGLKDEAEEFMEYATLSDHAHLLYAACLYSREPDFDEKSIEMKGLPEDQRVLVQLVGQDGNAYSIMSRVSSALRRAGHSKEVVQQYLDESRSGDYSHLLYVATLYSKEPDEEDEENTWDPDIDPVEE